MKALILLMAVVLVGCGNVKEMHPQSKAKPAGDSTNNSWEPRWAESYITDPENGKVLINPTTGLPFVAGDLRLVWDRRFTYSPETPLTFEKLHKMFKPLALKGVVKAQHNMGVLHENGYGTPIDNAEAFKWYTLSATQGFPNAMYNLAFCYVRGKGTPKNLVPAYAWLSIASLNGHAKSTNARDNLAKFMQMQTIAKAQELAREMPKKNPKLQRKSK